MNQKSSIKYLMYSINTEDLTICYSRMGLLAAQLCLIAALKDVKSCHVPNLPTSRVPNLIPYDRNLTSVPNVPKIEQCLTRFSDINEDYPFVHCFFQNQDSLQAFSAAPCILDTCASISKILSTV
jgi:hypothetical protein